MELQIRLAEPADAEIIAEFNQRLAWESEQIRLDPDTVLAGVRKVLSDPHRGRYFVACVEDRIVGQLMHTWEWSDWRNGHIWWLQSVYVDQSMRRRGVFRRLFEHARSAAAADPEVVGIRLYVEDHNQPAHRTYEDLGFRTAGYFVMEQLWNSDP